MAIESPFKIIEYPASPSGYVTFYNYKEPFTPYTEGHGYVGVLLHDTVEDKIQCHECGKWFESLAIHIVRAHGITTREYKRKVGLRQKAVLISENLRAKMVARPGGYTTAIAAMHKKLAENRALGIISKGKEHGDAVRGGGNTSEYKNMRGTCPEQLLKRIRTKALELGKTPTKTEINGLSTILKVFGGWNEAVRLAGLLPNNKHNIYTDEYYLELIHNFRKTHGRLPGNSDVNRKIFTTQTTYKRRFGSWSKALELAFPGEELPNFAERQRATKAWLKSAPPSKQSSNA